MPRSALGLIETVGLTAGIEAADAAVKAANVHLVGYELTRGGGMVVIKLLGDVGAVKAAVAAGAAAARQVGDVWAAHVIPRPHEGMEMMVASRETVGLAPSVPPGNGEQAADPRVVPVVQPPPGEEAPPFNLVPPLPGDTPSGEEAVAASNGDARDPAGETGPKRKGRQPPKGNSGDKAPAS